ncbi:MAG: DNA-binding response regulator [Alishewanella sp. 34-51-39]|nr:MAG: DNA-binding response regulator [Alishewanella sp. 34-51-39]
MLKVIVVDDEPLARKGMLVRLAAFPELQVVAECANGPDAIAAIQAQTPDLVFLDVEMPGMDGFAVLKALQERQIRLPYVVFVTAYDHYAFNAFEVQAVDYVTDKLAAAVARLTGDQPDTILERLDNAEPVVSDRYPEAISIKDSGEITRVQVQDIDWVDAAGDYMCIHTRDGQTHILRRTMKELESELDPRLFVRVHRSAIVNVNTIAKLQMLTNGEHQLVLTNGQAVKVSRSYKDRVKQVFSH